MKEHPYIRLGQTLGKVPFLQDLDDAGIDSILVDSVILECDEGDVLIKEGAEDSDFYVLLRGSLKVKHDDEDLAVLDEPGEIVGEYALATGEKRSATVAAAADKTFVLKVESDFRDRLDEGQQEAYAAALDRFVEKIKAQRGG